MTARKETWTACHQGIINRLTISSPNREGKETDRIVFKLDGCCLDIITMSNDGTKKKAGTSLIFDDLHALIDFLEPYRLALESRKNEAA
jgi:hypothetical protein